MSKFTDELMSKLKVDPDSVHLPAGGVGVCGRTGTGKSSLFYNSRFLERIVIADTGSQSHKLYAKCPVFVVNPTDMNESPIQQVRRHIEEASKTDGIGLLDSFSTLQEQQVLWFKLKNKDRVKYGVLSIPQHGEVVGELRDLALILAQAPWFTVFNTTSGGSGKTPSGEVVHYPAGALTGYQSLNGTERNKETILARWASVWVVFQGFKQIPRGLYVPGLDFRPETHTLYSPLKDPLLVIRDTAPNDSEDHKAIMAVPHLGMPENAGRSFIDELLVEIAAKFPRRMPAPSTPSTTTPAGDARAFSKTGK